MKLTVVAATAAIAFAGCSRSAPEPQPSAAEKPAAAAPSPPEPAASASAAFAGASFLWWTEPSGWTRISGGSPVRHAVYQVPRAEGDREDAQMVMSYAPEGDGGSVDDVIKQWGAQFPRDSKKMKREERTISGMKQWIVEARGTYAGDPGADKTQPPQKDFVLLGGIVEAPDGRYLFKLTGPKRTVDAHRDDFIALLGSTRLPG